MRALILALFATLLLAACGHRDSDMGDIMGAGIAKHLKERQP